MSTSADPDALRHYRDTGMAINASVRSDAAYLGSRLERLATSGSEFLPSIPGLDATMRSYADQADEILDSALLPEWGNRATRTSVIRIPAGQEIFTGIAGPQVGPRIGSRLTGGGPQVWIPRVDENWLVVPLTPAERLAVGGSAVTAGGGMRLPEALPEEHQSNVEAGAPR